MKKLYFLLIAMMVGLVAHAADYYLIGGFNNWSLKDAKCKFTAAGDGTYVLDYNGTLTSGFKINDGSWGDVDLGGSGTLELGKEFKLTSKGSNISLSANIEKPHIVLNPDAMTLLITGQEVEASLKYGIHGQIFGNSAWETIDMKINDEGKWIYTSAIVPGDFGIKVMDAASGSQTDWFSSADASNVITTELIGSALNVKSEGKNWSNTITGNITFTFDPKAMTLTLTGEGSSTPQPDPDATPENLYVIGSLSVGDWNTNTAIPFTKNGDVFTAEGVEILAVNEFGTGYFSFITTTGATWDEVNASDRFGAATADELIADGGSATIVRYAAPSASGGALSWSAAAGVYTITADFSTKTLTIVKTGEPSGEITVPEKLYIAINYLPLIELTKEENVFTIEDVEICHADHEAYDDYGYFCFKNFSETEFDNEKYIYGSANHYEHIASEQTVRFIRYDGWTQPDMHYPYTWAVEPGKYSFIVDFTSMTMYVEKTGELGIESVTTDNTPATYYNLQGQPIVHPTQGIYLKHQNHQTTKIQIK